MRKDDFEIGGIYHVFNKSIGHFKIYAYAENIQRFLTLIEYYNDRRSKISFSDRNKSDRKFLSKGLLRRNRNQYINIIAYCIMPDHYHLIVKTNCTHTEFCHFMSNFENAYSKYFNAKIRRKGPLYQSRFKSVLVEDNEQLLHLTRYIHLNPTTKRLVEYPQDWPWSSYKKYVETKILETIREVSIPNRDRYRRFVESRKDYQRKLRQIKKLLLE